MKAKIFGLIAALATSTVASATSIHPATTAVHANNQYGLKVMKETSALETENVMISPYSLQLALSMALNGAGGTTRDDLLSVMNVGFPEKAESQRSMNRTIFSLRLSRLR